MVCVIGCHCVYVHFHYLLAKPKQKNTQLKIEHTCALFCKHLSGGVLIGAPQIAKYDMKMWYEGTSLSSPLIIITDT